MDGRGSKLSDPAEKKIDAPACYELSPDELLVIGKKIKLSLSVSGIYASIKIVK
jgi:hypothetical protein